MRAHRAVVGARPARGRSPRPGCPRGSGPRRRSTAGARPRTSRAGARPRSRGVGRATDAGGRGTPWPRRGPAAAGRRRRCPTPARRDLLAGTRELDLGARERDGAALGCLRVDAFGRRDPQHLVDGARASRRAGRGRRARPTRAGRPAARGTGNSAEHQPPLRPEAPKPGGLRLEHDDAEARVVAEQVVRGPQPGEPGADDGDVAGASPGQRRPGGSSSPAVSRHSEDGQRTPHE